MTGTIAWSAIRPFGARIDLDLTGTVSAAQIDVLRGLFDEHHLLHFPGQNLSAEAQARVSAWFGALTAKAATTFDTGPGQLGDTELAFHSDLSCAPKPLEGLSLFGVEVGEGASPTRFVDAMAPALALEPALRSRLEGLHTINLWPIALAVRQRSGNAPAGWPGTAHRVLKSHPRTGAPIIYVNASHTDRIVELEAGESEQLIQDLFARLYDPANLYEHHWKTGDFIVWDNLALQHARPESPKGVARRLQRVEIGSADYMSQMPPELLEIYARL